MARAPFKPRIGPKEAQKLITRNIYAHSSVVAVSSNEYFKIIKNPANKGFLGSIVYDGLIIFCAEEAKAKKIITIQHGV